MKRNKKIYISIIAYIVITILIYGVYNYGRHLGKIDIRNESSAEGNWSFENDEFQLLLIREKGNLQYDMFSDASIRIKEVDKKNKKIVLILSEKDGKTLDKNMIKSFYLEKEMNNKWYVLDMRTIGAAVPTNNIIKRKVDFRKRI